MLATNHITQEMKLPKRFSVFGSTGQPHPLRFLRLSFLITRKLQEELIQKRTNRTRVTANSSDGMIGCIKYFLCSWRRSLTSTNMLPNRVSSKSHFVVKTRADGIVPTAQYKNPSTRPTGLDSSNYPDNIPANMYTATTSLRCTRPA